MLSNIGTSIIAPSPVLNRCARPVAVANARCRPTTLSATIEGRKRGAPDASALRLASPHIAAYGRALLAELAHAYPDIDGFHVDWPEYPPAPTGRPATAHVAIEVLPGDSAKLTREQRAQQAIERGRREVETNPSSADACNNLAWTYLVAPEALRDVKAALPLAENAVRLASRR